jgi:hypothetical protein
MAFHQKNWHQRFQQMGDEAENIFETVSPINWVRTGLNRPPISVSALPVAVRYMPDYLTSRCWVEVQGCGRDQLFKFKHEKLEALVAWEQFGHPVEIFLWNRTNQSHTQISLSELYDCFVSQDCVQGEYEEGKTWIGVPVHVIENNWTAHHVS